MPYLVRVSPGPQSMFYIQGGLTGVFLAYIGIFIKETSQLTDKEKKMLYAESKT